MSDTIEVEVGGKKIEINSSTTDKLNRGEIIISPLKPQGGSGVAANALAVVDFPCEKAWPVVRDAYLFSEFMPRTKSSRLESKKPDGMVVELEIAMPFPLKNLVSKIHSVIVEDHEKQRYSRRWSLVEGTYKRNNGEWVVMPWKSSKSLLAYWLDAEPKVLIPDRIIRRAQTGSLPEVFEAIRKRISSV